MNVADLIREHEGRRAVPYLDSEGILTWGIGRNIQEVPFSGDEMALVTQLVDLMFANDLRACRADMLSFPWFAQLDEVRQAACLDLRFNLGASGLREFKKFLAALARSDWDRAADELRASKWHQQVGRRAERIESMILRGQWP